MAGVPRYIKDMPGVVQNLQGRYNAATDRTGKLIGTLPKGALLLPSTFVHVQTAFNAGTAKIGTSGTNDAMFASADIAPTVKSSFKAVVNASLETGAIFNVPLAADTDIVWTVATAASGILIANIVFVYPYLLTDLR